MPQRRKKKTANWRSTNHDLFLKHSLDWAKAEQAYLNKVIKLYDRVRILGSSADVPLGNLFTQVYILDKPTARYRHDIEELRKRGAERNEFQRQPGERIHGLNLVKTGQNLFILGKPGAGKTTFLKYITIQAAHKQLPHVPIFVSLNQWADSRWCKGDKAALLPFLVEQFDICDFPNADLFVDYLLRAGRALILFDGLDEVKQEKDQRRRLTRLLQDFARKYGKSQYLITCRIAASEYAFDGFADVEVADFTSDQVREYARNWFGVEEKKFDAFTIELDKAENKGIAELCNTPLLLSLLCLTFDNVMSFPPNRAELYEDALDTLLRKWDSSRQIQRDEIYRDLSHKRKLHLLMNIAVPTFQKGELFFRQRDLEKWIVDYLAKLPNARSADTIDGAAILKAMEAQHSILVERAQGIYSFSHLTFQEYLTARYWSENQGKEEASKLILTHLTDQRWREVFLLTASLLDNADEFINFMRYTIQEIIGKISTILQLLTWAHEQTLQTGVSSEREHIVRLAYIFLDRSHARACNQTRTLALARTYTLALARILDFALERSFAHAFERTLTFTHSSRVAQATTMLVGFDYGLYCAWVYSDLFSSELFDRKDPLWQNTMRSLPFLVEDLIDFANEMGMPNLTNKLVGQEVPSPIASNQEWQQCANELFTILRDERNLGHKWTLNDEEDNKFNAYLYANELLLQCLKVAAVSDRQAILHGLLLPSEINEQARKTRSQGDRNRRK